MSRVLVVDDELSMRELLDLSRSSKPEREEAAAEPRAAEEPSSAARSAKPLPVTLTNVPPSTGPRGGSSARTRTGCWYSNCTPSDE